MAEQLEATHSNVSASATVVTLLEANLLRKGASFHNDSASPCNLKLAAAATASSFAVEIQGGDHYELPQWGPDRDVYRGIITGIWDAANGAMRIVEYT